MSGYTYFVNVLHHLKNELKNIYSRFTPKRSRVLHDIPYFSQFESSELVLDYIEHKKKVIEDPLWMNSGAESPTEYEFWAWRACGMTCLKMILAHRNNETYPVAVLAKECQTYGGYDMSRDHLGLIYQPFCNYVRSKFKLKAEVSRSLTIHRIKHELSKGNYIITSVHPDIRDKDNSEPKHKGGHLVLVVGYDEDDQSIFVHNPSGTFNKSQSAYKLTYSGFSKFFSKKGIVIYK
jgi:hypothetical protein